MTPLRCLLVAGGLLLATACANRETVVRCIEDTSYQRAYTTPALRVPDDLDVPDETDALRIPSGELGAPAPQSCLELSPGFEEMANNPSDDG
jgi:uncharacterized lipoprotein